MVYGATVGPQAYGFLMSYRAAGGLILSLSIFRYYGGSSADAIHGVSTLHDA